MLCIINTTSIRIIATISLIIINIIIIIMIIIIMIIMLPPLGRGPAAGAVRLPLPPNMRQQLHLNRNQMLTNI